MRMSSQPFRILSGKSIFDHMSLMLYRRHSTFYHSSARNEKDRWLPIFMQNNYNRMGNDSLSKQKLKNTYYFTSKPMQVPDFGKESTNFLKWKDL